MFIDSNIFLEVELGKERGWRSKEFLEKVERGEVLAITSDFHVDSVLIVMENYGKSWVDLATFLSSLVGYKGLSVLTPAISTKIRATEKMGEFSLDFDDALTVQMMIENNVTRIVSFDHHFDGISNIIRIEP